MNPNIEYERFTQEIYQGLINADDIKTIDVQHNVKLTGKSGQEHQIDVYWEYEYAGVRHKVAIECKNYNSTVSVGEVRDFYGVLSDLTNVAGIMVTKVGYQEGAKKYAAHYGINLKELRPPNEEDGRAGEIDLHIEMNIRRCLFLLDDENLKAEYRSFYIQFDDEYEWATADWLPLETTGDKIIDKKGQPITTFDELESKLPQNTDAEFEHIFDLEDAYVDTRYSGRVKIKGVKYACLKKSETKVFIIDARNMIKAILKDALNGEIKFFDKNGNIK